MNKRKRDMLKRAQNLRQQIYDIISNVLDDEQDCLDNTPENLQSSENYERMVDVVSKLEDALELLDEVESNIETASN